MRGVLLYIDPGTGSMLFTILIGIAATGMFFVQKLILKIKFRLSGGKVSAGSENRIPYVIFSDSKRYWNTFKPICDEFERRGIEAAYWTASPDDPALEEKYGHVKCEFIGEGNRAFARLNMMSADVCLSTTPGLDVLQWKRSRNVKYYVHILHETGGTLLYRMFGMDYYDAILLTGDFQIQEIRDLEASRGDPAKELKVVGCPYMDEMKKRLESAEPLTNETKTILLAPSWGKSAILTLYGEKIIEALLKTGYHIVIRPHPQSMTSEKELLDRLMKAYPDSSDLEWNFDPDNFEILRRSDLMITDFSGVIFDFTLVFGKPIIYAEYEFDPAPYDAAWVDRTLWRDEILPKLGVPLKEEQFGQLKELIDDLSDNEEFAAGREQARNEAWMNIGRSAALTVDYLVDKKKELDEKDAPEPAVAEA